MSKYMTPSVLKKCFAFDYFRTFPVDKMHLIVARVSAYPRFPEWYFCPKCKTISANQRLGFPITKSQQHGKKLNDQSGYG